MFDICDGCGYQFKEGDALHHYNNGTLLLCDACYKKNETIVVQK